MKPLIIHLTLPGPNSWKVVMICEELGIPYEIRAFRFKDVKKEPFISINPNGRTPAIDDPNTEVRLWESAAIIRYIIDMYSTKKLLGFDSLKERHLCNQWLVFQISGQGPDFGQADLAFAPWNRITYATIGVETEKMFDGFPNVKAWHERVKSGPLWIKAYQIRAKLLDEQGLIETGMPKGLKNMAEYQEYMKNEPATT